MEQGHRLAEIRGCYQEKGAQKSVKTLCFLNRQIRRIEIEGDDNRGAGGLFPTSIKRPPPFPFVEQAKDERTAGSG